MTEQNIDTTEDDGRDIVDEIEEDSDDNDNTEDDGAPTESPVMIARSPFRRQKIGELVVPMAYEVWADGVFERQRDKVQAYLDTGARIPRPDIAKRVPFEYSRSVLKRIADRPVWIANRGSRPASDAGGSATPLVQLCWRRYASIDRDTVTTPMTLRRGIADEIDRIWCELSKLRTKKSLLDHAMVYDLPVWEHNAGDVSKFLALMYEANFETVRSRNIARRTGYYALGGHSWLIGQTSIGSSDMIVDSKDLHKIQTALHTRGSYEDWVDFTKGIIFNTGELDDTGKKREEADKQAHIDAAAFTRWSLACSFAAPLLRHIGCRIFVVHHFGMTRCGKTSSAELAQSVWGYSKDQLWNWNASEISLNEVFRHVSDISICFNELQSSRLEGRALANVIYAWCEGTPRERTSQTGGLLHSGEKWHCLIRTTGEQSIVSRAGDVGGLAARVLEIPDLGVPQDISKGRIYPFIDGKVSYGHAGIHFLTMLSNLVNPDPKTGEVRLYPNEKTGETRTAIAALRESYKDHREALEKHGVDEMFTDRLAAVQLAERLMLSWIYGVPKQEADRYAMEDALFVYKAMHGRMGSTAPLWQRVLNALLEHQAAAPQLYCDLDTEEGRAKARRGSTGATEFIAFKRTSRDDVREVWYSPSKASEMVAEKLGVDPGHERIWGDLASQGILRRGPQRLQLQRSCSEAGLKANAYYFVLIEEKMGISGAPVLTQTEDIKSDWGAYAMYSAEEVAGDID